MNCGFGIGVHTEKSHHQYGGLRLSEVKALSTMIGGGYTIALARACSDIIIAIMEVTNKDHNCLMKPVEKTQKINTRITSRNSEPTTGQRNYCMDSTLG